MAMAAAELGDFEEAAAIQRGVLAAAERAGLAEAVRRMQENLQVVRTPAAVSNALERRRPGRAAVGRTGAPGPMIRTLGLQS